MILVHELGHYLVAKKKGYKLDNLFIAAYGICLNYKDSVFDGDDEFCIALAGPLASLVLGVILSSAWWIFPGVYNYTSEIAFQSISLGLFNLLPCYPLDGGRILCSILSQNMNRERAVRIVVRLNYTFSIILFAMFLISCFTSFNPTFFLASLFLVTGNIDFKSEAKYNPIVLSSRRIKNFSKPRVFYADGNLCLSEFIRRIEINKFTIFIVNLDGHKVKFLDEVLIKKLSLLYPINTSINQIFKG